LIRSLLIAACLSLALSTVRLRGRARPFRGVGGQRRGAGRNLQHPRALVPEVLVRANEWALVRPRVTAAELIALDRLPGWL
jgi:hypothetical protein